MKKFISECATYTSGLKLNLLNTSLLACLVISPLGAAVVSIDIDNATGVQTQSGEAPHADGLALTGQVGDWFSLAVPDTGAPSDPATDTALFIDTGSGIFTLAAGVKNFTSGGATVPLRRDVAYWLTDEVSWSLTGLIDGASYNVILFGGVGANDSAANSTNFSIEGHDPGSGLGGLVELDDDFDGNFTNVIATAGEISGTMIRTGAFGALAGIQFEQIIETIALEITEVDYVGGANPTVTLTWPKTEAESYNVKVSLDLMDWGTSLDPEVEEGDDENPSDTENITVTFPLTGEPGSATTVFFRIEV